MISLENINDKLREYQIPDYMREDVRAYLFDRQPMGSFLEAVFQNDLAEAFRTADETNRRAMWDYANFIHNELPSRSYGPGVCPWGSVDNVRVWIAGAQKLWACDECGCTDVQETAWIYMNTGENTGGDGALEDPYCPQCESETRASQTATEPKPYE